MSDVTNTEYTNDTVGEAMPAEGNDANSEHREDRIVARRLSEMARKKNEYKARALELEQQLAELQKALNVGNGDEVSPENEKIEQTQDDVKESTMEKVFERDLAEIKAAYPSVTASHIRELPAVRHFAELRDRGITAREAYRIACTAQSATADTKEHLRSTGARSSLGGAHPIPADELDIWRSAFPKASEAELIRLYNKNN